jgi:hypothetical protein
MDPETGYGGVDWVHLNRQGRGPGFYADDNELLGYVKGGSSDKLSDY